MSHCCTVIHLGATNTQYMGVEGRRLTELVSCHVPVIHLDVIIVHGHIWRKVDKGGCWPKVSNSKGERGVMCR